MSGLKDLKDEDLQKVAGGDSVPRIVECPGCGVKNEIQYSYTAGAVIRGVCSNCGLDYRGRV